MQQPPRIVEAKVAEVEVLPPSRAQPNLDPNPIHALSALILVAVDSLWAIFDWLPPLWIVAIPLCFLAVFVPVFLIQRHLKQDQPGRALAFGTLLGVLAALPLPIFGTPVGIGLLAWTGLGKWLKRFPAGHKFCL